MSRPEVLLAVLSWTCIWLQVRTEFFTAMADLEKLLQTEREVVEVIDQYIQSEEKRLEHVRWLNSQYEEQYNIGMKDSDVFLSNPVNAFLLIKRLTADLKLTYYLTEKWFNKGIQDMIAERNLSLPTDEDLNGAGAALLRLQQTYHLETQAIARGEVAGKLRSIELNAGDCFELGRQAHDSQKNQWAVKWTQQALKRLQQEDRATVRKADVLELMAVSYFGLGNAKKALEVTQEIIKLDPQNFRAYENMGNLINHIKHGYDENMAQLVAMVPKTEMDVIMEKYERLCRGEEGMPANNSLRCYYTDNRNPFLLLQPIKIEVLYQKPRIIMFHDVLNSEEVEKLQQIAKPKLERAVVQDDMTGSTEIASYRISKSAWLEGDDDEVVGKVNRRLEVYTGLSGKTAESFHVINYGIGGQYEPHFDFAFDGLEAFPDGNRIATFITYLSDVDAGGATVFPEINVTVFPKKGSATFWYNLYKNGNTDMNTLHAGCPVLVGSKWVGTRWFHQMGQEFRRLCDKDPNL